MRTIKIFAESVEFDAFLEVVGVKALSEAIGYLSTWGFDSQEVHIFLDQKSVEMVARYMVESETPFVIGAVYSKADNKFSFHS